MNHHGRSQDILHFGYAQAEFLRETAEIASTSNTQKGFDVAAAITDIVNEGVQSDASQQMVREHLMGIAQHLIERGAQGFDVSEKTAQVNEVLMVLNHSLEKPKAVLKTKNKHRLAL